MNFYTTLYHIRRLVIPLFIFYNMAYSCTPTSVAESPVTTTTAAATCPTNQPEVGPCVDGACPSGATCVGNSICCQTGCPTGQVELGPCTPGCQTGATCVANTFCCGVQCAAEDQTGPCMPDGTCPAGSTCDINGQFCCINQ